MIPTRVAGRWRSALTSRKKGTIVPSSTIEVISAQTGRCRSERCPSSETSAPTRCPGKLHHGAMTAKKSAAKPNPHASSGTAPRLDDRVLGEQDVERVGRGRQGGKEDPRGRDGAAPPDVDDQREPDEGERQREPDPATDRLLEDVARPEGDEERREILDEERDPDREPVDREEVEPLHEREPADPEEGEERQLAGAHAQPRRARDERG